MPTLKTIGSIKIVMYFFDHNPPHFHAYYNEHEAVFEIESLLILKGKLPNKQRKVVIEWAEKNQSYLSKKWDELN